MKANCSFSWNRALNQLLSLATGLAIVLAGAPGTAFGQAKVTSPKKATGKDGGAQEGIKVHGHWTIVVRNPDGSLASRREFENALQDTRGLTFSLARRNSVGYWYLRLRGIANPSPCSSGTPPVPASLGCVLKENPFPASLSGTVEVGQLTVAVVGTQAQEKIQLSGTFTASAAGEIAEVSTIIGLCPTTTAPSNPCTDPGGFFFSGTTLTPGSAKPPVAVANGQIVQVSVVLSFS